MSDWNQTRQKYKESYIQSGISLAAWCKSHGIDYQSARKQIKVSEIKAECKNVIGTKRQKVITPQPQKANHGSFGQGNQAARTHGAYAKHVEEDDLRTASEVCSLDEELLVSRARLVSVLKQRQQLDNLLHESRLAQDLEQCKYLSELLMKLVDAEDRAVARIESLCITLSKLKRDTVMIRKDKAQAELLEQSIMQRRAEQNKNDKVIYNISW
ncbi:hypothetical protein [Vibrio brasiliensis]|uniref:Putative small subunit terminase from prophage n=1 Tax=Vibrio brasiliensis LMG 20546 TaxID=945543 RepID=E8LNP6_9VIBR|nr:hypothetical protein [Vibrio brasiliensis]EGA67691.1 putative small subunit terminase from prophage [Vibrio brasiliensis LMG 20546]